MPRIDMTGQRFGRLTVGAFAGCRNGKHSTWRAVCDCGASVTVLRHSLTSGRTLSCGCLNHEAVTVHGGTGTPEHMVWAAMIQRCTNPKTRRYRHYGARGIRVCDRWRGSFAAFLADVGHRPSSKHSLDRIDNDGNYEPGNVRWATATEQNRNRRNVRKIRVGGRMMTLQEAAEMTGLTANCIWLRLRAGKTVEQALETGKGKAA